MTSPQRPEQLVDERLDELLDGYDPAAVDRVEFLGTQFDLGLAWVHFPEEHGGLGAPADLQRMVAERLRAAEAPTSTFRNPIGLGMVAPTIVTHGTRAQKRRYLRPLFTGEEVWCQLFSEPGAGSDVAGLACRATLDGDEWVVNGQKVWTTLAHLARWGYLLARTDPDVPKHRGLTAFVVDMTAPGVEVRPLRQMTGDAEFNEVYLTDARIPDTERLGERGEGWRVATTTLMNERVSIGETSRPRGSGPIGTALSLWAELPDPCPVKRHELVHLWVEAEVNRLTNLRARQLRRAGTPGPEGSIAKLSFSEINQRILDFCVDLMGSTGMLYGSYAMHRPAEARGSDHEIQRWFLRSRANSIEGGTSEVLRTLIGERVLGLPPEPRVDKDAPWNEGTRTRS